MKPEYARFRNPMDEDSVRSRLAHDNDIYTLAARAVGHQSAFTVDKLSWKLKQELPALIARLAAEVEAENLGLPVPPAPLQLRVREYQPGERVKVSFGGLFGFGETTREFVVMPDRTLKEIQT